MTRPGHPRWRRWPPVPDAPPRLRRLAERYGRSLWLVLTGLGIALAIGYWWLLTVVGGSPVDAHAFWAADSSNLYVHGATLSADGYYYSPAYELVVGWGRPLDFAVFTAIWRAVLLAAVVWLAGPLTLLVLVWPPLASEINAGNIQALLALAIVLGFRWPGTWVFVVLTKVSPGVGLLWFAIRREWRRLAVAVGVIAVVVVATFAFWPDRWDAYVRMLVAGAAADSSVSPWYLPFWERLPFALLIAVVGAIRGWRWSVVVAATVALPVFYAISPSLLIGTLPFLRGAIGRWLGGLPPDERLPRQPLPGADAMLAT